LSTQNFLEIPGLADRGVLTQPFCVIRKNAHPAILIEGGYLTDRNDATQISWPKNLVTNREATNQHMERQASPSKLDENSAWRLGPFL
jgi:N-acetylmuramoyl-L-alanine amidase